MGKNVQDKAKEKKEYETEGGNDIIINTFR